MTDTNEKPNTPSGITSEVATDEAVTVDINTTTQPIESEQKGEAEGQPTESTSEGGEEGQQESAPELPEYDPENPEVRTQYEERYYTADGELNTEAVSTEYWKSFEAAEGDVTKAGLSEGTYAFLKDVTGLSKAAIKDIEAGLVAKHREDAQKTYEKVGGQETFNKALSWAREGGYTKEQQDRFNAAIDSGGDTRDEALELLVSRFSKANPQQQKQEERRRGPKGRFSSRPERDATSRATSGGKSEDVFKSREDHSDAWQSALERQSQAKASRDPKAIADAQSHIDYIHRKARRSPVLTRG